jgi:hypothetical protein
MITREQLAKSLELGCREAEELEEGWILRCREAKKIWPASHVCYLVYDGCRKA